MPFDKNLANKIRRQARIKLLEEFRLRDPDLRRLVGHANLLGDLLVTSSLAGRGWEEEEEDVADGEVEEGVEVEEEDKEEGVGLFEDEDDEEDEDENADDSDDTDDDTDSGQESDDSSDDGNEEWWDQPLVSTTVIEAARACAERCDKATGQVVKTAEEVIAITEVTEGSEIDVSEDTFLGQQPSCSPGRLDTTEEMDCKAEETSADVGKPSTLPARTRLLTPKTTFGGTYGTFGDLLNLDPV